MKLIISTLLAFVLINGAVAGDKPLATEKILKQAYAEAAKENKKVMVIFHASWCGWCHRMDTIMNLPQTKSLFDKNFVIRHLVVMEAKDKTHLENPGALEFMIKNNGDKQGIPFWLILDSKGTLLADSRMPAKDKNGKDILTNTGCPAQPEEVAYFTGVLHKTTNLTESELAIIAEKFILKPEKR
jgi:thiol-disulfide isomerase/thioredoxin